MGLSLSFAVINRIIYDYGMYHYYKKSTKYHYNHSWDFTNNVIPFGPRIINPKPTVKCEVKWLLQKYVIYLNYCRNTRGPLCPFNLIL